MKPLLILLLAMLVAAVPATTRARSLTVGVAVDTQTLDPHASTETNTLSTIMNIYEALVRRDRDLHIEPGLATEWRLVEPTRWRFKLRQGVVFQDGAPLTVDDVVFSLQRAQSETSDARPAVRAIDRIEPVDAATFDIVTRSPDPILLSELCNFYVMSKAWTLANHAETPFSLTRNVGTENFATRHADGTGPFMLSQFSTGERVTLVRNPRWWDKATNDLTEVNFLPIVSDATRVAALLSGNVDLINPVPEQAAAQIAANPAFRIVRGPRPAVMYLGMDQHSDRLKYGDAGDRNPFKDVHVRRAMMAAIDEAALRTVVMRGAAIEAGSMIPSGVDGFRPEMAVHPKPDIARARQLMADAGYADGFGVTLDCTNDQYPSDEQVCTALAPMLARIGIRVTQHVESRARFFPQVTSGDTSFYLMAWYAPTFDAHHILWNTLQTKTATNGLWNAPGFSDPQLNSLIDRISAEMDPKARNQFIADANAIERDKMVYIPLYQLTLAWAERAGVDVVQRPDNRLDLRYVTLH